MKKPNLQDFPILDVPGKNPLPLSLFLKRPLIFAETDFCALELRTIARRCGKGPLTIEEWKRLLKL